ncbi:hypothetical protein AURDEDRAFT_112580 [Auricularia subglabra TFB-10046 SS5]|nr:hypothetical protein AURDEDRAFT_112580 [Auricularia subglabra TFB-10046 SS5]
MATAARTAHFALTKRLWDDVGALKWEKVCVWDVFPNLKHFCGGPLFLRQTKSACCFTMRGRLWQAEWSAMSALRHVTHLRMPLDAYYGIPNTLSALPPDTALRVVVLESETPGWNPRILVGLFLPFFLASATLEKLLICATTHLNYMCDVYAALEKYAWENKERRLWVLDEPTNGRLLGKFRAGVTFDPRQWSAGRQLYHPTL